MEFSGTPGQIGKRTRTGRQNLGGLINYKKIRYYAISTYHSGKKGKGEITGSLFGN